MKAAVILALALVLASVCLPAAQAASTYGYVDAVKTGCTDTVYTNTGAYGTKNAQSGSYAGTDSLGAYGGGYGSAEDQPDCCC